MLTGTAQDCGPHYLGTFPPLQVVSIAVKLNRKGRARGACCSCTFAILLKMNVKMSFFDVVCEVNKDLQDVSAGIDIFLKISLK
jgi:hypothetical protein